MSLLFYLAGRALKCECAQRLKTMHTARIGLADTKGHKT